MNEVRHGDCRVEMARMQAGSVQEITPADVQAEGLPLMGKLPTHVPPGTTAKQLDTLAKMIGDQLYSKEWDALNPKRPWASNPWHFTYDLMRTEEHD